MPLAFAGSAWVEALCAQALIRPSSGPRVRFTRVRDVTALLWATVLAVTVNSLLVGVIEWRAGRDVRSALLTSWIRGFLGILLFTPLMIAWARPQETTGPALRLPAALQLPLMLQARALCLPAPGLPGSPKETASPTRPTAIGRPGGMAIVQKAT